MSALPIRALKSVLRPGGTPAFLVLSVAVGVLVGLAAAILILSLDLVGEALSELRGGAPWEPLLFVPVGLLAAWLVAKRFAPEVVGDGVPDTIEALALHGGRIRTRTAPLKLLATTLTLGLGGSAGREGPMVQVGGSIGSSLGRHWGVGEDQVRSLVAAGAGAAIGASFNAPIAGMLFAIEVLLRNFAVRHVNSVVLASVAAAVTSRSIVGEERILRAFPFGLSDPRELLLYAVLGVLAVVAGVAFLRALDAIEGRDLPGLPKWAVPVIGGLAVGGLAMIDDRFLGSGQEAVGSLVGFDPVGGAWWGLMLLAGGKIVATVLTIGSRGSGGAFMPSLFIGAALGAGFARLVSPIWSITVLQPGAFSVVGMAAVFAAVARAPLTAMLIVFEITGDYGLVLPLMLVASLATVLGERFQADGVYTMALRRRGIVLGAKSEIDLLDSITVSEAMSDESKVPATMLVSELVEFLDERRSHGVAVTSGDRLLGMVTITDIARRSREEDTTVDEIMTKNPITIAASQPVSAALERMAALGVGRLPIVHDDDPERLVGLFKREGAVRAYQLAMARNTGHEVARQRLAARTHPGAEFFDLAVPVGSPADGRLIRELSWPSGSTVVSVRRGSSVAVPTGDTELVAGDVLTIYGTEQGHMRLLERIVGGAEA